MGERRRERLIQGRGVASRRCDRHLYQAVGEESAAKREVYHWPFVLPKQEENTFVQA